MRFLFVGLVLLGLTPLLDAACRARVRQVVAVQEVVAVAPVVVAQYVPLIVATPAYGVGYAANAVAAPGPAEAVTNSVALPPAKTACEDRLSKLEQEVQALKGGGGSRVGETALATATPANAALTLFQAKCASCHESAVAKEKGKGFVLLKNGNIRDDLTAEELNNITKQTYSGRMPKKDPAMSAEQFEKVKLTDQDYAQIMDWMVTYKGKK